MRRAVLLTGLLFVGAACSAATPNALPSGAPTDCPAIAVVRSFVAARDRADGASAAALFTSDGFIDAVNRTAAQPGAKIRIAGPDRIKPWIDGQLKVFRSIEITEGPEGCGAETTWSERHEFVNPLPGVDRRAKASTRDGKIASIVYAEAR